MKCNRVKYIRFKNTKQRIAWLLIAITFVYVWVKVFVSIIQGNYLERFWTSWF